ncbi:MAG: hypothetical protein J7604_19690 [Sporocytophaga sp.]|uniref:hypothetical protein n=1 Tax=Sporocytophaga sp. TaxID=2231183 RepID=UPI001B00AB43|nr:hypothetical protein [Sporocytophaga sp.]MBO9702443.1 hypothetical protein [Sporocytophaga sp.]
MKHFFLKAGYFLPVLIFLLVQCTNKKENDVDPTKEEGYGEIVYQSNYKPSVVDVTIAKVFSGKDTLYYFGSTDENGGIKSIDGYFLYDPINKSKTKVEFDKVENAISISESKDDESQEKTYLELKPLNDTLVQATGYEILHNSSERKILFQYLKKKEPSSKKLSSSNEDDELVKDIKEYQVAAMNCTHQYGILGMLSDLDKEIKNGNISTDLGPEIENLLGKGKSAAGIDDGFLDKLSAFAKKLNTDLRDFLTPDVYKAWKILDRFEFVQPSGDGQTVVFGKSLEFPLTALLTFDNKPARNQTVVIKQEAGSLKKEYITTSDELGYVSLETFPTKIQDEASGIKQVDVTFYKGGLLNKNISFVIYLKNRPRLTLIKDESTDNQAGEIGGFLKKPLSVMIKSDDGTFGVGYEVKWSDPIGKGFSFPATSITDKTGNTENNLLVVDHDPYKVKAEIAASDEYVVLNDVEFTIHPTLCPEFVPMEGEWTMSFGSSSPEKYYMTFMDDHTGICHNGVDGSGNAYENKDCSPMYPFTWTVKKGTKCYIEIDFWKRSMVVTGDYVDKGNLNFTNASITCSPCYPPPNCP